MSQPVSLSSVAPWVSFALTVAGAGWYVSALDSRVSALEAQTVELRSEVEANAARIEASESTVLTAIQSFRCAVEERLGIDHGLGGCR